MVELKGMREKIDLIDLEIIKLIEKRAEVVKRIGELKEGIKSQVYVPERELEIFERVGSVAKNIPLKSVRAIFTEIISACRSLEKKIKILNIGKDSEKISFKIFGSSVENKNSCDKVSHMDKEEFEKFDFLLINIEEYNHIKRDEKISNFIKERRVVKINYKEREEKGQSECRVFLLIFVNEFSKKEMSIEIE